MYMYFFIYLFSNMFKASFCKILIELANIYLVFFSIFFVSTSTDSGARQTTLAEKNTTEKT